MAAVGVQNVCLDSSMLSSCSSLRPSPNSQRIAVRSSSRSSVQCCCSRQDDAPETSTSRLSGLGRLAATGLMALAVSTSSGSGIAMAQQQDPSLVPIFNVGEQADKLLKDADKLTNDDSPPRFGPSRGGVKSEDDGRIAQKGGSGAIPEIQDSGSELVGKGREKVARKASETKQRLDESLGQAQDKAEDAKKGIQGFFGQAKGKVKSDVDSVQGQSKDPNEKLKGLVGDARSKADDAGDNAKDLVGSIKKGLRIR
ncbi:uncharacterized protein LOC9644582 isoform X2 [Selaginella moellendorffii]|uniref:uncharacterized protein LOC9644582 isoform X2 n=1 Tax=Selaginella moellendorffii TaxID=88036 RepID=UPI000D1C731A|nr:uncharacterized protein LOC9644582 isoform X2 [Selaginella moellendorffii]|eukprot:XP_024545200.1 uncharacterized protein LOC9644582 isoform X2 [Selaginella moellendorffii]